MSNRPISSVVVEPASEPVTVAEAKIFLRVDHSNDDDLIGATIKAARAWAESYTRRKFVHTTLDCSYRELFDTRMPLYVPYAPLVSVSSVKYYDGGGTLTTLDASNYVVKATGGALAGRGYIEAARGASLPALDSYTEYPVIVRAVCGYGSSASSVPDGIKSAIKLMLGDMYEQRQESVVGTVVGKTFTTVERLLAPYRLIEVV